MTTQTTTTPAVSPLMEIALRIREMRRITGFTEKEMAEKTGVTEAEYRSYETGTVDLPFTFLHKCSLAFGLELTDLLEGQSAKLSSYSVTRRGCGLITAAEDGITIRNMAALFRQKLATPYWVTYQYSEELQHQPIHTTTHGGQEFDLVLKGSMRVRVGDHEETLHEGDSIFYKSSTPHGMIAVDGADCTFLAMIMRARRRSRPSSSVPGPSRRSSPSIFCVRTSSSRWRTRTAVSRSSILRMRTNSTLPSTSSTALPEGARTSSPCCTWRTT